MSASNVFKIKPAGRHILTIGRDLIQDRYAAVVELVKNAYDADSPDVNIKFWANPDESEYSIVVSDHGHGMSRDTVINKWMVPSTPDKVDRRISPSGRTMQGRKGVGRYAASILGADMLLETITAEGEKTTVLLEWRDFEQAQYLDDVEILIDTEETSELPGTKLTMTGDSEFFAEWNQGQFDKLRFELKKLISPVSAVFEDEPREDEFSITLTIEGVSDELDVFKEKVEPYPIFELFDYRIAGKVSPDGKGSLTYSMQKVRNATHEHISFEYGKPTDCGLLVFDIRVYDREQEAIGSLIQRGLKNEYGNYVKKNEARGLLNKYNGIGVYRNGFRIRPLGDPEFDWLRLNKRRVQNPSLRIGSNQAIGYVQIQSDELSGLVEKSARDGLKENPAFDRLKDITEEIIAELEAKRFKYRRNAELSKPTLRVEQELERLFSFDEMKQNIRIKLDGSGIDERAANEILEIIERDEEDKNQVIEKIRQTVAIYQGQATLGKIINVVLHEGRRPLNYFRNQIRNLRHWYKLFQKTGDIEKLDKVILIVDGVGQNADVFVKLFSRLDPLAAGRRPARKPLVLKKEIRGAFHVFEAEMKSHDVSAVVTGPEDCRLSGWSQDIYAIFINLIDNSLYWMNQKEISIRKITINIVADGDSLDHIDYRDTGPGIEPELLASEVIFEPQFSTKPSGTGLGLAIAGEAAARSGLELRAFESDEGALFRLQPKTENRE